MSAYMIKPVAGDGFCTIRAFQESLRSIGKGKIIRRGNVCPETRNYTTEELLPSLQ